MTTTPITPLPVAASDAAVRPAGPADRATVGGVLAAAFADDPVFAWLVPDRAERVAMLPSAFDAFAEAFARHGATHLRADAGVAMWSPPGAAPVHPDDEDRLGARLAADFGPHMGRVAAAMEVFGAAHPEEPAWFLQFLGVEPGRQGQGHGSALLRAVLDDADRAGEAAYLEATSPANRRLYERHGFRRVADLALPGGPTAYAMWRDPAPAGA
jgi:ribosomal protein S18 acetylase RimI-like enzyme